ncbi:hypothetical protein J4212_06210 [Candidatus Woesearchaeota archaeon]|nr:hypothetical protein [Candidatus Woesearchaeota archaeon]
MYNVLVDSDALIKIPKAGFLHEITRNFKASITEDVHEEAVREGKSRLYQDADKIQDFVSQKKIIVIAANAYKRNKTPKKPFGKGETSLFQAYGKGKIIVTDDLSFIACLREEGMKWLSSPHLIIALVKGKSISRQKALYYADRLKPYIRKDVYEAVKNDIGE